MAVLKTLKIATRQSPLAIAVHSMKDVPMEFPEGLGLSVICKREDPRDAFVSNTYRSLDELPQGAIVGTSSLRRQCQLKQLRPDLDIRSLRGNVGTRLSKLDNGEYDAIILASAGQGAVGIECRVDDEEVKALLALLSDATTTVCVLAERAMNTRLQGGCQVPIGGYAIEQNGEIFLRALVGETDGSAIIRAEGKSAVENAEALGVTIAEQLLAQGADKILAKIYSA